MSTHCALAFIMFQEWIDLEGHRQAWKTRVLSRPSFVPPHTERRLEKGRNIWLAGCSASDQKRQFKVEAWFWPQVKAGSGEGNGTPLQYSCLENPMESVWGQNWREEAKAEYPFIPFPGIRLFNPLCTWDKKQWLHETRHLKSRYLV